MRLAICIDDDRLRDDRGALTSICKGLATADIEQTHILCEQPLGVQMSGLIDSADLITTRMPAHWPRRMAIVQRVVDRLARNEPDAVMCSGFKSHRLAADLAATFEVPLLIDAWHADHIAAARWRNDVDTWLARSGGMADGLKRGVRSGRVVEARPPLGPETNPRTPGRRPSMVMLDPLVTPRDYEPLADAVAEIVHARDDLQVFVELRGRHAHRIWRLFETRSLLERVSMLNDAGAVADLVGAATVVVAPGPTTAARTVIAQALLGGAALVTALDTLEDLAVHDSTALLVDSTSGDWAAPVQALLDDPARRGDLTHRAIDATRMACLPDTAIPAWIHAVQRTLEPVAYPVGTA